MQDQLLLQRLAVLEARVAQIEQQALTAQPQALESPDGPVEPTIMVEPPPMASPPSQPSVQAGSGNPYWQRRVERERREAQPQPPVKPLESPRAQQPAPEAEAMSDPLESPSRLPREERGEMVQERARRKAAEVKIRLAQSPDEVYERTQAEYQRRQQWAEEHRGQVERRQAAEEPLIMKPPPPAQQEQPAQPQPAPAPEQRRAAPRTPWTSGPTTIPTIDDSPQTGPRLPQGVTPEGPGRDNDEIPHQTFGEATVGFANRTGRVLASMAEQLLQLSRRLEELESAREMETHE